MKVNTGMGVEGGDRGDTPTAGKTYRMWSVPAPSILAWPSLVTEATLEQSLKLK